MPQTACIARPAISPTRTRSSIGWCPRAAADRTTKACNTMWLRRCATAVSVAIETPALILQQTVDFEFAGPTAPGIRSAGTDIHLAIDDAGNRELDSVARPIPRTLRTVPKLGADVSGVVGMQYGWPASLGSRSAVLTVIQRPHDAIGCPTRRNCRGGAREAERAGRLR